MKRKTFLYLGVLGILVILLVAACSPAAGQVTTFTKPAVTRTISVTRTTAGSTGPQFIVVTIPALTQTATVGPLTGTPPHSLHTLQYPYDYCFQCHPIPPGHEGRAMDTGICYQCHLEPAPAG
jgi:hypothetical protein